TGVANVPPYWGAPCSPGRWIGRFTCRQSMRASACWRLGRTGSRPKLARHSRGRVKPRQACYRGAASILLVVAILHRFVDHAVNANTGSGCLDDFTARGVGRLSPDAVTWLSSLGASPGTASPPTGLPRQEPHATIQTTTCLCAMQGSRLPPTD